MKHKFSQKIMTAVSLTIALVFSVSSFASIQTYDPKKTRKMLLELSRYEEPSKIRIQGEFKSEEARRFMDYYMEVMTPELDKISTLSLRYRAFHLLMDTGSYRNKREMKRWQKAMNTIESELNVYDVSEEWTEKLQKFSDLAGNLEGDLPDSARRIHREREKEVFAPEMKPLLDELGRLGTEFGLAVNQADANKYLAQFSKGLSDAVLKYRGGEMSFEEAYRIITDLHSKYGSRFVGYQAVQTNPERLNRMAVIRSTLAKSKGFDSWADFVLHDDEGYSEVYRGVEKQREFLLSLIQTLAPRLKAVVEERAISLGMDVSRLNEEHISLALPKGVSSMRPYFPASEVTRIWIEGMKESGFDDKALSQVLVDDKQRPKKNATGAYMMPVYGRSLDEMVIDAATLTPVTPDKDSELWQDGLTYILQTYKIGGNSDSETMFHEGGHALEKAYKFKNKSNPEAYAYVETPSMTMEYFMRDPEFLWNKMVPVDGGKPSIEEVRQLVRNVSIADAYGVLGNAGSALFDINLWDYDYSAPGARTFLQRVEELYNENQRLTQEWEHIESNVPHFYSKLSTPHFWSGSVRYMGYVFADMSSRMMKDYVYDEIEKSSGRRTWYQQPGLKEIFADRFFAEGWKTSFPENIEGITGRRFEPKQILEQVLEDLDSCASYLKH